MCGIAGAFGSNDWHPEVRRMTAALGHRGPDDEGIAPIHGPDGRLCGTFGHRRLSILDLTTAGHQPMVSPDGRYVLVFNGEIYNFRALRHELAQEGVSFRSETDTEVLLFGLIRHGIAFLRRLRGMFALGLWDGEEGRGMLARDPFGIKPLYLAEVGGAVLFASEIRALLESGALPRVLDPAAVRSYLATGSVSEPLSIISGVRTLPAGAMVEVRMRGGRASLGPVVHYQDSPVRAPERTIRDPREAAVEIRSVLRDSVAHHMVSDVPVGFFLSGGIDSSALVGIASEVANSGLNTFTVTFAEQEFSEAAPARAVAERFGTDHHEIELTGGDLLSSFPAAFTSMDQPSIDGLNTYVVSKAVRERGIKVVLSGLGGDELFAGYPSFRRARSLESVWRTVEPFRRALGGPSRSAGDVRTQKLRVMLTRRTPALGAYQASRVLFTEGQVNALVGFGADMVSAEASPTLSLLQQVSWYEVNGYMRNTLLRDGDIFSMAHGLELRVPYVDIAIARVAMELGDSLKLKRGASKPTIVSAVRDLLPTAVWDRPKQGFTLPFDRWMRQELKEEMTSVFEPSIARSVGMAPDRVWRVWEDFSGRRSGMTWSRAWALYTLLRWARDNRAELRPAASQREPAALATA